MKYIETATIGLILACNFFFSVSCNSRSQNLKLFERAELLCKYIPDHGPIEGCEEYLTPEYFHAYMEAYEAPVNNYGGIGEDNWLWYFVSGNGGDMPKFNVHDVLMEDSETAVAVIGITPYYGDNHGDRQPTYHLVRMKRIDGEWLLDNFDSTKEQCHSYVYDLRKRYDNGDIVREMMNDTHDRQYVPTFKRDLQSFYKKYGRNKFY